MDQTQRIAPKKCYALCKRITDTLGAALLLILFAPLMLLCAICIKVTSAGPVIFRQQRVGYRGRLFCMYKFRSMYLNNEQSTRWTIPQDERKTAFGAFLRKFSLDELPQLFNVLKGEMSLVGPRPELPYFEEKFQKEIPGYLNKHQVRPGMTGWAQIHGLRGDTSVEERTRYDLYYMENRSFLLDIRILLVTVFCGKFINNEKL